MSATDDCHSAYVHVNDYIGWALVLVAWLRERAEQIEAAQDAPRGAVAPNSTAVDPRATEGERGRESGGNEEGK